MPTGNRTLYPVSPTPDQCYLSARLVSSAERRALRALRAVAPPFFLPVSHVSHWLRQFLLSRGTRSFFFSLDRPLFLQQAAARSAPDPTPRDIELLRKRFTSHPTLPTYLTKVITLATQAEDRLLKNFLQEAARPLKPQTFACPAVQTRPREDVQQGNAHSLPHGAPHKAHVSSGLPRCFCGQHGHPHNVCAIYKTFCTNRKWARHVCPKCLEKGHYLRDCKRPVGKYWGKDEAASKLLLEPRPQARRPGATQDVVALGLNQVAEMEVVRTRGCSKLPNFTKHDENIYHALGQALKAARYGAKAWTATQERMF
ncbi:hypothetical protein Efla_006685 [Eimeria flavescens]